MTPEQLADMREKSAPIKIPPEWARKYYDAKFGLGEAMKDIRTLLTAYDEQAREIERLRGERIICAAIRCPDGTIIKGHRHHDCIRTALMIPRFADNSDGKLDKDQGFVTSTDRYVDRKEAAAIAIESGQIEKLNWSPDLFSEDLY